MRNSCEILLIFSSRRRHTSSKRDWIQTCALPISRVGGVVLDESGEGIPFANIIFPNSSEGTITNDDGSFYMESENRYDSLSISYIGYQSKTIPLDRKSVV